MPPKPKQNRPRSLPHETPFQLVLYEDKIDFVTSPIEGNLIVEWLITLGSAILVVLLFHALHLPAIVGFLTLGMIVGPNGLGLVSGFSQAHYISELGTIFLMFTLGLEFSIHRLRNLIRPFLGWGAFQVLVTGALFTLIGVHIFQLNWNASILIGCLASLSSTATILKLLEESRTVISPYGQTSIGVLLFQDVAIVPMVIWLASQGPDRSFTHASLLISAAVLLGIFVASKWIIPFLFERVARTRNQELFFFFVVFVALGSAWAFELIGLSLSLGAFVAGVILSESPYGKQATAQILTFRDAFLAIFFISIGMLLDIRFAASHIHWVLLIFLSAAAIKVAIIYLLGRLNGYSHHVALVSSMILFQVGEFSFILAEQGQKLQILNSHQTQYFLAIAIISLVATPFVFRFAPRISTKDFFREWIPFTTEILKPQLESLKKVSHNDLSHKEGHVIIIGFGIGGQNLATALKNLKIPYNVIEMNPKLIQKGEHKDEPIVYGDAADRHILEKVGASKARLAVVTVSGASMLERVTHSIRHERPDLPIIVRTHYLREVHEIQTLKEIELVVGEIETSLELLARTLNYYGVASEKIHQMIFESKRRFQESQNLLFPSLRTGVDLPTWEALSIFNPIKLTAEMFAIGQNLFDLDLRRQTGASIAVIYREATGAMAPSSTFQFQENDVAYIVGSKNNIDLARQLLRTGKVES